MSKKWVNFYNKNTGEKLLGLSAKEVFEDEIESTIGLLSYENGINEEDIEVVKE